MGYTTKVQLINVKTASNGTSTFVPAIARMDFTKGEDVEWTIADRAT